MGEFASYKGEEIKIGTMEDMYYLRWDQAHLVTALPGNVNPVRDRIGLRFRFPFPDEDGEQPGGFEGGGYRGRRLYSITSGTGAEHGSVQFRHDNGYLVSLPCPEDPSVTDRPYVIHRNGYGGASELVAQRWWDGKLVAVLQCKGCRHMWRLPTLEDAQPVIDALHAEADEQSRTARLNNTPGNEAIAETIRAIADRLAAGYAEAPAVQMASASA